jgi:hypothetical protein
MTNLTNTAEQKWKTGMRVPVTDLYIDQYHVVSFHEAHHTFPPCIGRKGECAYRSIVR